MIRKYLLVGASAFLLGAGSMAYVGASAFAQGGNAGQLSQALGQETQQSGGIGSLLGGVLDQDGDGQFGASDLMKLGAGLLKR